VPLRLGIDIACRAAHQVSLADEQGQFLWTGRRFWTTPQDLARLWAMLPEGTEPAELLVIMEPTRNALVPLAAWFRRCGAEVVLVPPERRAWRCVEAGGQEVSDLLCKQWLLSLRGHCSDDDHERERAGRAARAAAGAG
jgi:Transposase